MTQILNNEDILAIEQQLAARVPDGIFAWATFDGEGGYDLQLYENNESYRDDYIKRNGEKYADWVIALASAPQPAVQGEPVMDVASTWWSLVMGAAAAIEDASNCLRDEDAKRSTIGSAKHYRERANALYTHPQPERVALDDLEPALEALVNRCNNDAGMTNEPEVIAAEAALERLYKSRSAHGIKGDAQ